MLKAVRLAIVALFLSSCVPADRTDPGAEASSASSFPFLPEAGQPATFAEAFEVVDTLVLEGGAAGNADFLFARFDGQRFTVAAPKTGQVSVYALDGSLVADRGGFAEPMSARRSRDGLLVVAEMSMSRRLIFMAEGAATEPEAVAIAVVPFDAQDLGGHRYLVTGLPRRPASGGKRPPHLHVWNAMSKTIEHSFFSPPRLAHLDDVAGSGEWASAAVRGDTIWAVSQFSDSIFVFATDGSRLGAVPLPLAAQAKSQTPNGAANAPWSVDAVHLLAGGEIVVQLGDKTAMDDPQETRYLVIVGPDGAAQTVLAGTSVLRVVADDVLYFEDMSGTEAGRWVAARLREIP